MSALAEFYVNCLDKILITRLEHISVVQYQSNLRILADCRKFTFYKVTRPMKMGFEE